MSSAFLKNEVTTQVPYSVETQYEIKLRRSFVKLVWQKSYGEVMLNSGFWGILGIKRPFPLWKIKSAWKTYIENAQYKNDHLSLYLHIPFCQKICNYCNLNRWACAGGVQLENYMRTIEKEMRSFHAIFKGVKFKSLYVGGGTPNILTERQIERILSRIHGNFSFAEHAEKTFECNPNHSTSGKLEILADYGINRISFGIQSLDDGILHHANRGYQSYEMVKRNIQEVRRFPNLKWINADLLIGLRDDTPQMVSESFVKLAQLEVDEMSLYPLSPPPDYLRKYYSSRRDLFDLQLVKKCHDLETTIVPLAKKYGYDLVRTNHSDPGKYTWNFVLEKGLLLRSMMTTYNIADDTPSSCLGLGVGAWSMMSNIARYRQCGTLSFCKNQAVVNGIYEWVSLKERPGRLFYVMTQLVPMGSRLFFSRYKEKFGTDIRNDFKKALNRLQRIGALVMDDDTISFFAKTTNERFVFLLFFVDDRTVRVQFDNLSAVETMASAKCSL